MSGTQLTVGMLRRLLDSASIDDDTPIMIEVADPDDTLGGCDLAQRAYAQASDAVPVGLGGTDPQFENTRAVLILTNEPGAPVQTVCEDCHNLIEPDGNAWRHSDGHDYRHPARPGRQRPFWARWARLTDEERWAVWESFCARTPTKVHVDEGWNWGPRDVDPGDPDTWDPLSPLSMLLRIAAAGDLTPLADALHAARTPTTGEPT